MTGSLLYTRRRFNPGDAPFLALVKQPLVQPDEWFTLEIISQGGHRLVKVNGTITADVDDEHFRRGHIALQNWGSDTVVQFRKIEIKELSPSPTAVPQTAAEVLPYLAGNWKLERQHADPMPRRTRALRSEPSPTVSWPAASSSAGAVHSWL
jgi:hypothetical protein